MIPKRFLKLLISNHPVAKGPPERAKKAKMRGGYRLPKPYNLKSLTLSSNHLKHSLIEKHNTHFHLYVGLRAQLQTIIV